MAWLKFCGIYNLLGEMARRRFVPITSSNDVKASSGETQHWKQEENNEDDVQIVHNVGDDSDNSDYWNTPGPGRDAPHEGNGTNRTIQGQAGDSSAPKRASRHTRINDFWKLKRGEKAPIPLNEFGAPVRDLGGSYCNFLGTIARHLTYCPLPLKIWTISNIGEKWRMWKCYIKSTHFDFTKEEDKNVEGAKLWLKERGVCFDQYCTLVRFWQSEKGKKASERGKTNMSNGKVSHATRSKEFRRSARDMFG
ncbi:hypothetical protein ACFE04_021406 [Oxalis oulophora]